MTTKAYEIVGYTEDGAFYCVNCYDIEDIDDAEVGFVFASSEFDSYPTCDACGCRCENVQLTLDGYEYEHREEGEDV